VFPHKKDYKTDCNIIKESVFSFVQIFIQHSSNSVTFILVHRQTYGGSSLWIHEISSVHSDIIDQCSDILHSSNCRKETRLHHLFVGFKKAYDSEEKYYTTFTLNLTYRKLVRPITLCSNKVLNEVYTGKHLDSKGFRQWCMTLGITGFLDFVHCLVF
jgi:hypothetical protein